MRTCPYCGSPVDDNSLFCGNCGNALAAPQAAAPNATFCQNCGQQLPAGVAFCPNCGAASALQQPAGQWQQPQQSAGQWQQPQQPAGQWQQPQQPAGQWQQPQQPTDQWQQPQSPPPQGPKSGKPNARLIGIIAGAAAAVVVLVVAIVAAVKFLPDIFASPSKKFINYQEDLFISQLVSGMESGLNIYGSGSFSTDLTITATVDNPEINEYLADSAVNLGINLKKGALVADGELILMGSPVLNGTATYEDGELGFLLPQVDDTYYVVDLGKVFGNLYDVDLDSDNLGVPEISGKQWRSLAEAYLDIVYATVTEDNVTEAKDQSVRLSGLGGSFTGTVYTFKPTAEDIEDMLLRLANRLESDKDLRAVILQLAGAGTLSRLMDSYGYYDYGYGYNSYGRSLEEQLDEALLDFADDLRDQAMRIGRSVEQSGFTWTLAVEGKNVRQIRISVNGGDRAIVYEAEGTEADKRTELVYTVSYGEKQNLVERSYSKTGKLYDGRIIVSGYYGDVFSLTYAADTSKKSVFGIPYGEYRISIPDENINFNLSVSDGANGGVDHKITFKTNSYYYDFTRLEVTVNATSSSKVKKPSQRAVDISNYSQWDFYDLFKEISDKLERELVRNVPDLFGSGYGSADPYADPYDW